MFSVIRHTERRGRGVVLCRAARDPEVVLAKVVYSHHSRRQHGVAPSSGVAYLSPSKLRRGPGRRRDATYGWTARISRYPAGRAWLVAGFGRAVVSTGTLTRVCATAGGRRNSVLSPLWRADRDDRHLLRAMRFWP